MSAPDPVAAFVAEFEAAFADDRLVRLKCGGYRGPEADLKATEARKIVIKAGQRLSCVFQHRTHDVTKNLTLDAAGAFLRAGLGTDYRSARLETVDFDLFYEQQGRRARLKRVAVKGRAVPETGHDRTKNRPLNYLEKNADRPWLRALELSGETGEILAAAQDKFRQINRMVEIFAPLIEALPGAEPSIVDMGAGKGYLDFALYDYLMEKGREQGQKQRRALRLVGVERRAHLVAAGNRLAEACGFAGLRFVQADILDYDARGADAVIALHACDTASDDAIFQGVAAGAKLIAVAPCCHRQVRGRMAAGQGEGDDRLDFLLRHGIFMEKQAEMVTDGLRALLLEAAGYRTRIFEFVSDAHTPKNNLIVAQKGGAGGREAALERLAAAKAMFGIDRHYLETLLDPALATSLS